MFVKIITWKNCAGIFNNILQMTDLLREDLFERKCNILTLFYEGVSTVQVELTENRENSTFFN